KRIADGDRQLSYLRLRWAEWDRGQMDSISPQNGKIGVRIVANQCRMTALAVGERDDDFSCAMHDVAVGKDESVGCQQKPRAAAHASRPGGRGSRTMLPHLNRGNRGTCTLRRLDYGVQIGIKQLGIVANFRVGRRCRKGKN